MLSRILALDIGEKRIGVAISDELNITAQGKETIEQSNTDDTLNRIKSLVKEYNVSKIIVGIPLNMDGTKGNSAKLIERFTDILKKEIPISIELFDERLTTREGERLLISLDISRKKRKQSIDKIAAQLILQSYLEMRESI